jgi:2-oxoacid:acceptor oxidoreductase delta subunit (pyruvate/2-ketoisovalerate family)
MKAMGPNVALKLDYTELPIGATQIGPDSNLMKTGTWRFVRPMLVSLMPPCTEACPAAVDIREFISLINKGMIEAALDSYLEENPFPAILGRVCFHPCETACNRNYFDEALSINGLENYISSGKAGNLYSYQDKGKYIAIIGSGPSGLSCAYFLKRLGYSVKIFERERKLGGILRYAIPEYRLPKRILDKEIEKLKSMGVEIQTNKELGKNLYLGELNTYNAIYIATGAHKPAISKMPGIEAKGVYYGLDFLKKVATGDINVSTKNVIVIGGGNTAIDVARTILRLGGKSIIYYRRTKAEMPADNNEINDCEREGIEINPLTTPQRILTMQDKVKGVGFIRNNLGALDTSGRPAPVPAKGTNFYVNADIVILAIGEQTDLLPLGNTLKKEGQLIKINEFGQSSIPKIFAGGDITHYQRTVVNAVASGKRAAIGIDCYLQGLNEDEIHRRFSSIAANNQGGLSFKKYIHNDFTLPNTEHVRYEDCNTYYFQPKKRNERREIPVATRVSSFKEVRKPFSLHKARKEAERCFNCGLCNSCGNCYMLCPDGAVCLDEKESQVKIDYDYCKGCGICMEECPRGAIHMEQEE